MATVQAKTNSKYRVLDWGAGNEKSPCSITYLVGDKEKRAVTGDVVDDIPQSAIGIPGQEELRSFIIGVNIEKVGD